MGRDGTFCIENIGYRIGNILTATFTFMLYVVYGSDSVKVRKEAHALIERVRPGVPIEQVSAEEYSTEYLESLVGAVALFSVVPVFLLDSVSDDEMLFEDLLNHAGALGESPNTFVVLERSLGVSAKKVLTPCAREVIEVAGAKEERFNTFVLADALLRRDKKTLWLLFCEAQAAGISSEEIVGTLHWQLKVMRLALRAKSAEEAGVKPFVFDKARRGLAKYQAGEIDEKARSLLLAYHRGHAGECDLGYALESWILSL